MKIAVAGILSKRIQANSLGGTEQFTYLLVEKLVKDNYDVSLYSTSDSVTSSNLLSVCNLKDIEGIFEAGIDTRLPYNLLQSVRIAEESNRYDLIHNNYFDSFLLTAFSDWISCPIISTVHNDFWHFPHLREVLLKFHRANRDKLVFVSNKAQELAGRPPDSVVIHNGIDESLYRFSEVNKSDSLFWVSRIVPKKGSKEAIEISKITGNALTLIGRPSLIPEHKKYFDQYITPNLSEKIKLVDNNSTDEKIEYFQSAKAFLFPIQWEEPFGFVVAESMACGTPVITYARGAMPEIVQDGVTGFLVNSSDEDIRGDFIVKKTGIEGMVEAVNRMYALHPEEYKQMRHASRKRVEEHFTVEKMVSSYEKLYKEILQR